MSQILVRFVPDNKQVNVHAGITILEAAGRAGIILNTPCGGAGTCRKCAVGIDSQKEPVLACQTRLQTDTVVTIPQDSRFYQQQILQHGVETQIRVSPSIRKVKFDAIPQDSRKLIDELDRINGYTVSGISPFVLDKFQQNAYQSGYSPSTVVLRKNCTSPGKDNRESYEVLCIEQGDTQKELFGIAVDIGTTTVVAKLVDMQDGQVRAIEAMANPQIRFGDDVIARISHAGSEEGYAQLHDVIIECLNQLIAGLCTKQQLDAAHIYELTAAGNTTMSHLLAGHPVTQLGQAPYKAHTTQAEDRNASQISLNINPCGNVHIIENIAGYVGSDTTAAALAVGMDKAKNINLLVDIGTNGELVLGTGEKMYSASCAAGPAMEGARIRQGSRAIDGAIEKIHIEDGDICVHVIGNVPARSICGSGIIDAVAVLLDLGLVDQTGRFLDREELAEDISPKILNRLTTVEDQPAFILSHGDQPVCFTQRDVRETQLSKGAMRAGMELLLQKAGITADQIDQILLAGAFGNYIRRKSAFRIGLLPAVAHEKVIYVGNAASTGAQMILLSHECRTIAAELVQRIEYVEIAHMPEFQMVFAESMMFEASD